MRRSLLLRLLLLPVIMLVLCTAATAIADVPSPSTSTVPACLIACPAGDFTIHIVVRDLANNIKVNSLVVLDFSACPSFTPCPQMPGLTVDDVKHTVSRYTDVNGVADFPLAMGGICLTAIKIFADGVQLRAPMSLASPDRDGNLSVDTADQAAIQSLVGSADPTADLDCDGAVTAADVAIVAQHLGHTCASVTPAQRRSWGALKLIYR